MGVRIGVAGVDDDAPRGEAERRRRQRDWCINQQRVEGGVQCKPAAACAAAAASRVRARRRADDEREHVCKRAVREAVPVNVVRLPGCAEPLQ
eukprot:158700-Chlamydomonas_euryale.AAC.1